ncbi:protein kinase [Aliikangiella marina]|uniref:Protein kinase n=1 Tax=Aliikangiella marina TaxID=1712262 RepID=A0A545TGR2_9GAMM|nr:protein kinase [Aliikangiella marina]TQV76422.1 protein kinase [Aliikangiella marina]
MKNSDQDKNKPVVDSAVSADESADKTRIAPSEKKRDSQLSNTENSNQIRDDKTRIAKNPKVQGGADDKTRFAPGKSRQSLSDAQGSSDIHDQSMTQDDSNSQDLSDDKTRIAPNKPSDPDATQFRPSERRGSKSSAARHEPAKADEPSANATRNRRASDSEQEDASPRQGNLLKKRFILEKVLGAGGMGVVYKAKDLVKVEAGDKDPYVAIKVLTEEFKEHPEAFVALQRESRKTQRIAHPNIVNVHDFDKDKSQVFMTMEYLEGKPLDQLIRQYKSTGLPSDDSINILRDLCQALIYAHEQKIIHSDFKPGNIFVTDKGVTKIFDFGIARAVAKAEHYEENLDDKTIFDAGDLGALTPAYASLEMLDGLEPDVRDDIYALGCVAYELFTGTHPFNKIPADEAHRQKLKPKKINGISRRLWKAIEKSLSFKREDRLASAEEFLELMSEDKSSYKIPMMMLFTLVVLFVVYFQFFREQAQIADESEIRNELEYTLRIENYRDALEELLVTQSFTESWETDLWTEFDGVSQLLGSSDTWLASSTNQEFIQFVEGNKAWQLSTRQTIYASYLEKIRTSLTDKSFEQAESLITNAYRYVQDTAELDAERKQLDELLAQQKEMLAEEQRKAALAAEQEKIRKANEAKFAAENAARQKEKEAAAKKLREFNLALSNVEEQLQCTSTSLTMRNLTTAVEKLRSVDMNRYKKAEANLVSSLASCIGQIGKTQPERATELKKGSLRLFNRNKVIAAVEIIPRDPCDKSLAGLGARGKRATCKDPIANLGNGPDLVVIPAQRGIKAFAIGKYEVSVADLNLFCKDSKSCPEETTTNPEMPATNINLSKVNSYLTWLSVKTGKKYRLPTKNEWLYAAKSKRVALDPNRNCRLNTRGITKGDSLVRTDLGRQNGWGLVNYVGNASEWVYDKGRKLTAIGGSYNISMEKCNISTAVTHNGEADSYTGFRVLRELK